MNRRALLGAAFSGAVLAACGGPGDGEPAAEGPHPAVGPAQAERVLTSVDAALDRAFEARNPRLLGARVTGPAGRSLAARLTVADRLKRTVRAPGPLVLRRLVLPAAADWPRWFLAAGEITGAPTPVVRVLRSVTPREPFGLWGELSLLPGASLPALASPQTGTPLLAGTGAQGLVAAPADVVAAYAKALTAPTSAVQGLGFALDQFREQVTGQVAADQRALLGVADVTTTHRPASDDGLLALRTADGGALVVAALEQLYRVQVRGAARPVGLDPDLAALAGTSTLRRTLQRTSVELLAFRIPQQGGGPVTLVAAAKDDVSAVVT